MSKTTPGYLMLEVRLGDIDASMKRCDQIEQELHGKMGDEANAKRKAARMKKHKLKCLKAKIMRYRNEIALLNTTIDEALRIEL